LVKIANGPVSKIDSDSYSISGKRVKTYAIECRAWVHKRCSGVYGALTRVKDYECGHCKGFHDVEEEVQYIRDRQIKKKLLRIHFGFED